MVSSLNSRPGAMMFALLLSTSPGAPAQDVDDTAKLLRDIDAVRTDMDVPAAAIVVVDARNVLASKVLGVSDRASGSAADATTMFRIGSITKMFTALALLVAQREQLMDLEARAVDIAEDFPVHNEWRASHPIRAVHLLEHTAGLPDLTREEFDYPEPLDLESALALKAETRRARWPPGLHHSYTNAGAGLAAFLLERASGETYEDFVAARIFTPLGMDSATFFQDERVRQHLATGYDSDGHTVIPYWHMLYRAFGAINLRPADMAPFMGMLLNRGIYNGRRIVSPADIERMETPRTTLAARTGLRFGYGLGSYTWLHRGLIFHGHGGDGDGYLARLGYSRDRMMGYFIVINVFRHEPLNEIQRLVEDYIAGDARVPEPPPADLDSDRLRTYAGTYAPATRRFAFRTRSRPVQLNVAVESGELLLERDGRPRRLIPVAPGHFRYPAETVATSAFVEYAGTMYFQDKSGNYERLRREQ